MKRKDELRDIYQTNSPDPEKDFTPQVAQELVEQRQRDQRRRQLASLFFGATAIVVAVVLVAIATRSLLTENKVTQPVQPKDPAYTPRFSLSSEASWVIAYRQTADDMDRSDSVGEKPLSARWIKKAAYHIIMGQQALSLEQKDEAMDHFRSAIAIYPKIEGIRGTMGMLCIQKEQYAEAIEHLKMALEEDETFETANNLGTACIGTKDYESAEKHLQLALELQPENPSCHKNLAILYRETNRIDDACFHFEKYLDLRPDDVATMQAYALFLIKNARWEDASGFLEALTQEVTDDPQIYFLLAQVQVQIGQHEKAVDTLKRGMQLSDPNLALAWMGRQEFNDIRESTDFQTLVDALEVSTVSLDATE